MSDADNLEIKKRARRRLVGAIALALLAAIVLPMMMDQEPHPAMQDIQVTIPDRDERRPLASAEPAAVPAPLPIPEDDEAAQNDKLATAPEAQPQAAEPRAAEPPAAEPAPPPAATPAPRVASTPPAPRQAPPARPAAAEPRPPAAAVDEEARVRAILSGQAVPPRGEAFVVQVGAFSDAAKAGRLADELKGQGFQAYTERAGSVTRVRVGPIAGRAAADAVVARLKSGGHQAVLQPR